MFSSIGISEILIILVVALIIFGSKELGQVARSLGKGWRDIQRTTQNVKDEIGDILDEEDDLLG